MEIAEAQKFLADHHRGVLVARKRDGWPQITLVTPVIDPAGRVIVHSRAVAFKVKNIRRDPRVSLLVMGEEFSGSKYVQVHGTAEIIPLPEAMDLLIYWHRQARGEHPNWQEYRQKMMEEDQVAIRIIIERVNPSTGVKP
ncbi:MAG: TIGR03618 family F420-dependent PPOX class oxidoreductase [Candidatus Binatia bacterium]